MSNSKVEVRDEEEKSNVPIDLDDLRYLRSQSCFIPRKHEAATTDRCATDCHVSAEAQLQEVNPRRNAKTSFLLSQASTKQKNFDQVISALRRTDTQTLSQEQLSTFSSNGLILPRSRYKVLWDSFIVLCVIYVAIMLPFDLSFRSMAGPSATDYISDAFFALDLILQFNTAFYDSNDDVVVDRKIIAVRYIRGWFLIDLMSIIPFQLIFMTNHGTALFAIFRLPRLFRLGRIARFLNSLPDYYRRLWNVFRLFIWIFACAHWLGCLYHALLTSEYHLYENNRDEPGNDEEPWRYDTMKAFWKSQEKADILKSYLISTYAGVLMLIGDDFEPQTNMERAFAIVFVLLGACFVASLFGQVALVIQNLNKARNMYLQLMEQAEEHMEEMELPLEFRSRVREFYDYSWQINKCMPREYFLNGLSPALRSEVALYHHQAILTAPLFHKTNAEFLVEIVQSLDTKVFLRDDYIFKQDEPPQQMYFIQRGRCVVLVRANTQVIGVKTPGHYFGEVGVMTQRKRNASVRADTNCSLTVIDRIVFENAFHKYPEAGVAILSYVLKNPGYRLTDKEIVALEKKQEVYFRRLDDSKTPHHHHHHHQHPRKSHPKHPPKDPHHHHHVTPYFQLITSTLDPAQIQTLIRDLSTHVQHLSPPKEEEQPHKTSQT